MNQKNAFHSIRLGNIFVIVENKCILQTNFIEIIRYIYQLYTHFRIKHFVGPVSYDCREFVSRNRDHLDRNLSQAMFECQHPLLKILFPEGKYTILTCIITNIIKIMNDVRNVISCCISVTGNPRRTTRRRPATTSTQFKISLSALINNLNTKNLHFVRCIKPNDLRQPRIFNTSLVEHQIDYQG